jgi:hypothetical protein
VVTVTWHPRGGSPVAKFGIKMRSPFAQYVCPTNFHKAVVPPPPRPWSVRGMKYPEVYNHYKGTGLDGQHYLAFFRQSLQAKYLVQALIPNKLLRRCQPPRYGD